MEKIKFILPIIILISIAFYCPKDKQYYKNKKEDTTKIQFGDVDTVNVKTVTIDGYDPAADSTIQEINIWGNYVSRSYAGSVTHGEKVAMLKREGDGVLIKTSDGTTGWVTYRFIKELK